ncbi:uncharacterized protein LOC116768698 [Danaus plexippus]|uniref:uncharacterized protein LOC116768698 n=1 Tax=Danaus plexippus TaxID=13037 RepID=UPI002AAF3CFF|nr:uncharacterized protein LOC116768698 [Danaus plexippus]
MTNTFAVCLVAISFFCCTCLSTAKQIPRECAKGPTYWCESLKNAADCGAVGHCTSTVWELEVTDVKNNIISDKIVQKFSQLKDVNTMINADYLSSSISSACRDLPTPGVQRLCKANTADLGQYLLHVLLSKTTPQTICRIVGMCNNDKLENLNLKKRSNEPSKEKHLLGGARCTWGPSYWCSNFSTGKECKATHHCVQKVWSKQTYPEDNDSICKICKDMVKQARDQLESNQTQEDLKAVFEGECDLIPVKLIRKECKVLADDFVPELVETLSSQMNPDAVCSVAGLCNSERIDHMLEDYSSALKLREDCTNCRRSVGIARKRFDATSYEDFLMGLLKVCQEMGSLSDSCSMLVFKYYENIIEALKKDFTAEDVCHLSGQCAHLYHTHDLYTFPDDEQHLKASDDIPCEFCEQIVKHLRDTLVANTTKIEFKKILVGLCKHSGSFKDECLHLVDQYYEVVYTFLTAEMQPQLICGFLGVCKKKTDITIAPLLPTELEIKTIGISDSLIGADEANSYTHKPKQDNVKILDADKAQLPIERMFVSVPQTGNTEICTFCQYFLHYIQVELSDENTEEAIKKVVENACDVLPNAIDSTCRQFVSQYGAAVIALLVQEMDPAEVCPTLGLCPKSKVKVSDSPNCALCLFAVQQVETVLKDNKTEASIRKALDSLCNSLSANMRPACVNFVESHTDQLIEMLIADLTAQEICVFLKMCKDEHTRTDPLRITDIDRFHRKPHLRGDWNARKRPMLPRNMLEPGVGDIETNEIPDHTVNGRPVHNQNPVCVICEFVLKEIDDQIKDKHNVDEIKKVVHGVCKRMPKSVRNECDQFVEKYADLVISLLVQELNPDEVCQQLKLCKPSGIDHFKGEVLNCAVCESIVQVLKKLATNKKLDDDIIHVTELACNELPAKFAKRCRNMMEVYGESIIELIKSSGSRFICGMIGFCGERPARLQMTPAI